MTENNGYNTYGYSGTPGAQPTQPQPGQPTQPQPVQSQYTAPQSARPQQPTQRYDAASGTQSSYARYSQDGRAAQYSQRTQPGSNYQSGQHAGTTVSQPQVKADHRKAGSGRTFLYGFAGAALACVVGLGGFGAWQALSSTADAATPEPLTQQASIQLGSTQNTPVDVDDDSISLPQVVAAKCLPSVVAVDVYTDMSSSMNDFYSMFGYGQGYGSESGSSLQQSSTGSGVVMTADGYIITNNHVVEGGDMVKVTIEGVEYEADIVGTDPSSDIAVLKAQDAEGLTPMDLGDSDNLTIGEWVMSLGSPFGLEQSVATGIVSATSRSQILDASTDMYGNTTEMTIYPNMIQTDAAINPGNSGGALVNADGALIGINTLITSYSGNYSGVGFAIPVNYAVSIAEQIIDGQTPSHAQLGVSLSTVTEAAASRYGFSVDKGAYIASVMSGSGAAEAGLVEGDIVTAFDGKAVESADDLMLDVRSKQPGDQVTLTVVSGGETREIQVTLGSDANAENAAEEEEAQSESEGENESQAPDQGYDQGYGYGGRGQAPDNGYGYGYDDQGGQDDRGGNAYGYGSGSSILDELFGLNN